MQRLEQDKMNLWLDCLSVGMDNQHMLMSTEHLQCATKGSKWLSWDWAWGPQLPITITNMSELKQAHLSITIWNLMQIATKQGMPTKHTFFSRKYQITGWFIQFQNRYASACIPAIQKIPAIAPNQEYNDSNKFHHVIIERLFLRSYLKKKKKLVSQ